MVAGQGRVIRWRPPVRASVESSWRWARPAVVPSGSDLLDQHAQGQVDAQLADLIAARVVDNGVGDADRPAAQLVLGFRPNAVHIGGSTCVLLDSARHAAPRYRPASS